MGKRKHRSSQHRVCAAIPSAKAVCHVLTDTQVRVDGGVTSSSSEVLVLSVGNVQVCLRVSVLLGQSKVNNVDLVASLSNAHQEIVWLDVSVDEVSRVNVLDSRNLYGDEAWTVSIPLEHVYLSKISTRTIWSAKSKTVLRLNFRLQKLNRSSSDGPNKSITMAL
jgi:hypothetical protein